MWLTLSGSLLSWILLSLSNSCGFLPPAPATPVLSSGLSGQKDCEFSIRVLALEVSSPGWSLPSGSRLYKMENSSHAIACYILGVDPLSKSICFFFFNRSPVPSELVCVYFVQSPCQVQHRVLLGHTISGIPVTFY